MLHLNFTPFPTLTTDRLLLRKINLADEPQIFALRSNDIVNQFLDRPKANTTEQAKEFIIKILNAINNNDSFMWAITLKNDDILLGTIVYWNINKEFSKAELGYELLPAHQGKGIMQEALSEVIKFGFEKIHLQIIEGYVTPQNHRSIKLMEKNNFVRDIEEEKKMKENENGDGDNLFIYSLKKLLNN